MLELKFQVCGQHMIRLDAERLVAGSRNLVECSFVFDEMWAETVKTAIFSNGSICYHVMLTEDRIAAADMPVFSEGTWQVSVFGGDLLTADTVKLPVYPSGYTEGTAPEAPVSTVYETMIARLEALTSLIASLEHDVVSVSAEDGVLLLGGTGGDANG